MNVEIRKATENDACDIARVVAYSWIDTYQGLMDQSYLEDKISTERLNYSIEKTKKLINSTDTYFVATVDDKVVGMVYYEKSSEDDFKDYGYLEAIYLNKNYQGLGIGKMLFKKAVTGLKEMGFNKFYLHCLKGNNTLNFYKKYKGEVIEIIKYPLRDFNVDAEVVAFNDINKVLEMFNIKDMEAKRK